MARDVGQRARSKLRVETVRSRHIGDVSRDLRRIGHDVLGVLEHIADVAVGVARVLSERVINGEVVVRPNMRGQAALQP